MTAPAVERLSAAGALQLAADLIKRRGLCLDNYEGANGSLCPAGAVALALGSEDAFVWSSPLGAFTESGAYDVGFDALYALVAAIGRWDMSRPADEPWDGEVLANHVAFWLKDVKPSAELVVHQMRAASESLSVPAEQIEVAAHA